MLLLARHENMRHMENRTPKSITETIYFLAVILLGFLAVGLFCTSHYLGNMGFHTTHTPYYPPSLVSNINYPAPHQKLSILTVICLEKYQSQHLWRLLAWPYDKAFLLGSTLRFHDKQEKRGFNVGEVKKRMGTFFFPDLENFDPSVEVNTELMSLKQSSKYEVTDMCFQVRGPTASWMFGESKRPPTWSYLMDTKSLSCTWHFHHYLNMTQFQYKYINWEE